MIGIRKVTEHGQHGQDQTKNEMISKNTLVTPQDIKSTGQHIPLIKLLPVHSTCVVIKILVDTLLAHVIHVRVLTANTPPLGTSGVLVVVIITT